MKFAHRLDKVAPSVTLNLNARTLELKRQGHDIVSLGVGEPDIDTPEVVSEAGVAAIREHKGRYTATAGYPELRTAICSYIKKVYGLDYTPDCVMASSGAKQVLYNSIQVTAGEGDEVLIPAPYWISYPEMVHLALAEPVFVPTTLEEGLRLTPERLDAAITSRTRAIIFNSPSNPTGVTYSRLELEALAEVLRPHDIWVISDDIYCTLLFDGTAFSSMADIPGFRDRTIIVNGVSKTFSMTGWRVGFSAGSLDLIKTMTRLQDHSTSCPSAIAQYAAAEALRQGPSLTADWQQALTVRRRLMLNLMELIPGVKVIPPSGAFYLFADVSAYLNDAVPDTLTLAERCLMDGGVNVVPGEAFGAKGYVRLSFAVDEDTIHEGIRRFRNTLQTF
jgi:aspartate aminotransferase